MTEAPETIEDPAVADDEEPEQLDKIIPLNSDATFGVVLSNHSYVSLYERKLYTEDTPVTYPSQEKGGGMITKTYFAGMHGPWLKSAHPYPANLGQALKHVFNGMVAAKLSEAQDFAFIIDHIDAAHQDILTNLEKVVTRLQAGPTKKKTSRKPA